MNANCTILAYPEEPLALLMESGELVLSEDSVGLQVLAAVIAAKHMQSAMVVPFRQ